MAATLNGKSEKASQASIDIMQTDVTAIKAVTDVIPDSGAMTTIGTDTARLTAVRAQILTDWIDGGRLDLLLDAIKAVTDVIPNSGALTVPVADATANATWGDVLGNKTDAASRTADTISLVAIARKILEEATEIDHHFHNNERWWGAVAVPDETNAIDANVDNDFVAVSGNNTWGTAIPILGTADDPTPGAQSEFDAHRILFTDLDDDTSLWRFRIIYGYGTSGDAITAAQWTEVPVISNATPGNRAGGVASDIKMIVLPVGIKLWGQAWNDTTGEALSFQYGAHGYPAPSAPTPP